MGSTDSVLRSVLDSVLRLHILDSLLRSVLYLVLRLHILDSVLLFELYRWHYTGLGTTISNDPEYYTLHLYGLTSMILNLIPDLVPD